MIKRGFILISASIFGSLHFHQGGNTVKCQLRFCCPLNFRFIIFSCTRLLFVWTNKLGISWHIASIVRSLSSWKMGIRVSTASAPVIPEGLGSVIYDQDSIKSIHHIKSASVHTQRGGKPVNQDSAIFCQGYGAEDVVLCGVFDGHGKNGHLVSKTLRQRLPSILLDKKNAVSHANEDFPESQSTDYSFSSPNTKELLEWNEACMIAFQEMDDELKMVQKVDYSFSGSTAVIALKQGDNLLIANLGDSRAILGTKAENGIEAAQLTIDLKPGTPDEADRIRKFNGRVFALKDEPGVPRAWLPRIYSPGIAMSRCFGDFVMKHYGIISTPVITHHQISSDDLFVLLATDGIWDVLTNEEVVSIVCGVEHEEMAAKAVVEAAVAAWKAKIPFFDKRDDCTAVCYFLQKKGQTLAHPSLER